jgi:hypothetical protein
MLDTATYDTGYWTSWKSRSPFAMTRLPRGGVISILSPTLVESNDPEELYYEYNKVAFWSPNRGEFWQGGSGDEDSKEAIISDVEQEACHDIAEIWWRHWREKTPFWWKPKLYLLPSDSKYPPVHRFWDENHVLKPVKQGIIPLWYVATKHLTLVSFYWETNLCQDLGSSMWLAGTPCAAFGRSPYHAQFWDRQISEVVENPK